ncbi:MAG: hypothetical protein M3Q58_11345 [Bacteroidota bacterium]|nr:hypothetical protein [Bacteroidota bacterium]
MNLFEKIHTLANSTDSLDQFLCDNMEMINDFHNAEYPSVLNFKDSIERFILLKANIIESLDYSKSYNKAFVSILLEFCERFSLIAATLRIYSILEVNEISIGLRLQAGLLYLYNIDSNSRLVERFEQICKNLDDAIELEEDNDIKALSTFLNYYANVIINTPQTFRETINRKIENAINNKSYHFIQNTLIKDALLINSNNVEADFDNLQLIIDKLLNKFGGVKRHLVNELLQNIFLIEQNTEYASILSGTKKSFTAIRNISVNKLSSIENKDEIFYSLGRGVTILENENQMYLYMNSFGKMHFEKLKTAFEYLPENIFNEQVNIIDWGCGQAMATITYFDFLKINKIEQTFKNIILIDPSELTLKRAALHVKEYLKDAQIITINKDLDSLLDHDLLSIGNDVNLHLFSNILDIDLFSLTDLIKKIEKGFKGENYFVCVSPYITDLKTNRLDTFMNYFKKYEGFQELKSINNKSGQWQGNWTRVVRVFKTVIK